MGLTNGKLWQEVKEVYFPTPKAGSKSRSVSGTLDPRSPLLPGDNFHRTPLQVEITANEYKNEAFHCVSLSPIKADQELEGNSDGVKSCISQSLCDPRSPTMGIERTPLELCTTMPTAELATRFEKLRLDFSASSSTKESSGFVTAESEKEEIVPETPALEDFIPNLRKILCSTPNVTKKLQKDVNTNSNMMPGRGMRTPLGSIVRTSYVSPMKSCNGEPQKRRLSVFSKKGSTKSTPKRNRTPKHSDNKEN